MGKSRPLAANRKANPGGSVPRLLAEDYTLIKQNSKIGLFHFFYPYYLQRKNE